MVSKLTSQDISVPELNLNPGFEDQGKVSSVGDGVFWAKGLDSVGYSEILEMGEGVKGIVMNLEEDEVGGVILGESSKISRGDTIVATGKRLEIGAGEALLGRVIDPLGTPLDGKPVYKVDKNMPVDKIAPGIVARQPVNTPIHTGITAIDSMIPIGRGQRELIIGDRGTGKTAIATDTIINQKGEDVICIYVGIGQKRAKTAQLLEKLEEHGAKEFTIAVVASASEPASSLYLAPYVGAAIGEYFMDQGKDVLIVYDDLSKHAWAYREISLLLRRPSGREAYPGDIFYLHSRLLERACRLSEKHGGGSMTALPIIETLSGDVSAYIPTNVISITDGQIYLEPDLFFAGIRPALNVGLSVSRVGGTAQTKAMKKVAGKLRLDLTQYWELATFAQFATDTDENTKKSVERGKRVVELLKQGQYQPLRTERQVVAVYIATSGLLDTIPIDEIQNFRDEFLVYLDSKYPQVFTDIQKTGTFDDKLEAVVSKAAGEFSQRFIISHGLEPKEEQPQTNRAVAVGAKTEPKLEVEKEKKNGK